MSLGATFWAGVAIDPGHETENLCMQYAIDRQSGSGAGRKATPGELPDGFHMAVSGSKWPLNG